MISLECYKVFQAVAESGSFSGAAKQLYITQPAVSQSIRQLEEQMGVPLFIRQPRGVTLTGEGKILSGYVESALRLLHSGMEKLESMKRLEAGELRIGAGDTISEQYLLGLLEQYHSRYPLIRLQVVNRTSVAAAALLQEGSIDLALVNLPLEGVDVENLSIREWLEVRDIFVAGEPYGDLRGRVLTRRELDGYPLIMLENASSSRRYVNREFLKTGIRLQPEIELGAHSLLLEFAKIGLGLSCVIREFSRKAMEEGGLFEIRLADPLPSRHVGFCTLAGIPLSAAARSFIEMSEEMFPMP